MCLESTMSSKQIRETSYEADSFKRSAEARETARPAAQGESRDLDAVKLGAEAREAARQAADEDAFEVDAIQRRVAARKIARELERKKKEAEEELKRHLMERALRAKTKPAPVVEPSVWRKIYSGFLAVIKSKILHNALTYSALAMMVAWVGSYVYDIMAMRADVAFREHCQENNLKYAAGSRKFCYDDGRFVRKITESGVSGRLNLDWSVNDRQLRMAIKAAERAAGPAARPVALTPDISVKPAGAGPVATQKPIVAAPVVVADTVDASPATVSELAALIMRN